MTLIEIKAMLDTLGYPVAYSHFKQATDLPFICYLDAGTNNYNADNAVYQKVQNIDIELYFEHKNSTTEKALEDLLNENGITWESYPDVWIEDEKVYRKLYEIGVIN